MCRTILQMSEQEIENTDLHTIYKLIDVHADFNKVNKEKKNTKEQDNSEVFIDNIIF